MEITLSEMLQMQQEAFEAHKDCWEPRTPEFGKEHILFMIEEIGEMIAILKKKGEKAVLQSPSVRSAFVEEMADVLMYYNDVLLCYGITPEELSHAYLAKHSRNLHRNYTKEYGEMYSNGEK